MFQTQGVENETISADLVLHKWDIESVSWVTHVCSFHQQAQTDGQLPHDQSKCWFSCGVHGGSDPEERSNRQCQSRYQETKIKDACPHSRAPSLVAQVLSEIFKHAVTQAQRLSVGEACAEHRDRVWLVPWPPTEMKSKTSLCLQDRKHFHCLFWWTWCYTVSCVSLT